MAKSNKATVTVTQPAVCLPAAPKVRYAQRTWGPNSIITVNVANPKKGDSLHRFALYQNGMSVAQYVAAVVGAGLAKASKANSDLRWDSARKFITIA
jgi:hypothetical protein